MNKIFIIALAFTSFVLTNCTSTPKKAEQPPARVYQNPTPTPSTTNSRPHEEIIDSLSLQKFLRLDLPLNQLGYFEKAFNTCRVGFGYLPDTQCRNLYFVVINYQIKCRQSEGTLTTALTEADLTPVSSRSVKWFLKNSQGNSQTDAAGLGQIAVISPISQKSQRLRISIGENFLYMRASEIKSVITPQDWCN